MNSNNDFRPRSSVLWLVAPLVWAVSFVILYGATWFFPFNIPNGLAFCFVLSVIATLVTLHLALDSHHWKTHIMQKDYDIIFLVAYMVILFLGVAFHLAKSNLSGDNNIMFFATFGVTALLTFFMPGYSLITLTRLRTQFNRDEKMAYSVILSTAVSGLVGMAGWNMGNIGAYGVPLLLVVNLALLVAYSVGPISRRAAGSARENGAGHVRICFNPIELLLVCSVVLFVFVSYFTIHDAISDGLPLLGDEFVHVGLIEKILAGYFSWQETQLQIISTPAYPYLWHLAMAISVSASGLPVTSVYLSSALLFLPLPVIAIKSFSLRLTGDRSVALLSVVIFSIFAGLGWIVALMYPVPGNELNTISNSAIMSYDIIYSTWLPVIVAPYLLDITVFLLTLSLIVRSDIEGRTLAGILTLLIVFAVLVHLEKVLLLAGLGLVLSLLQLLMKERRFRTAELGIALFVSTLLVALLDFLSSKALYMSTYLHPILLVAVTGLIIWGLSTPPVISASNRLRGASDGLSMVLGLTVPVGLVVIAGSDLVSGLTPLNSGVVVPLYLLPIKLGLAGVLATIYYIHIIRNPSGKRDTLLILTVGVFITGAMLYHGPYPLYAALGHTLDEFRFIRDIAWPIASVLAAGGVGLVTRRIGPLNFNLSATKSFKKPILRFALLSLIIGSIIAPSILSHMLKIEYMTAYSGVTDVQQGVAGFLSNMQIDAGASIYSPVSLSHVVIASTGSVVYTSQTPYFGELLGESDEVSSILFTLWYLNISHIITGGTPDNPRLSQLVQLFPRMYNDAHYCVYKVVLLAPPEIGAGNVVLSQLPSLSSFGNSSYQSHIIWADRFDSIDSWHLWSNYNITDYEAKKSTIDSLQVWAKAKPDSRAALLLQRSIDSPLDISLGIKLSIRFRTHGSTRLVAGILLSNGSLITAKQGGSYYMSGDEWTWASIGVYGGSVEIVAIVVGVTNYPDINNADLMAEIDTILLSEADLRDADLTNLMSIVGTRYTVEYSLGILEHTVHDAILAAEGSDNRTLTHLIELASRGNRVIVFGELAYSEWASQLIEIGISNETTAVDCISTEDSVYPLSLLELPYCNVTGATVVARYGNNTGTPLIMQIPLSTETHITYVNLWPMLDSLKQHVSGDDKSWLYDALRFVVQDLLGLEQAISTMRRFYLKSSDSFVVTGLVLLSCLKAMKYENDSLSPLDSVQILVEGSVTIEPYSWGYVNVTAYGNLTITSLNGTRISIWTENLSLLLKLTELSGSGILDFASLTSGIPFTLNLFRSEYRCTGPFRISTSPITCEFLFLIPHLLPGLEGT